MGFIQKINREVQLHQRHHFITMFKCHLSFRKHNKEEPKDSREGFHHDDERITLLGEKKKHIFSILVHLSASILMRGWWCL
jgi:hypothetical protein